MRGKGFGVVRRNGRPRITPAYAGKSQFDEITIHTHWDHPRVCGEKPTNRKGRKNELGSPPRMRGKDCRQWRKQGEAGITPAYAGKRLPSPHPRCPWRDHPRVCGEKRLSISSAKPRLGSPPRMRGKGAGGQAAGQQRGITPAYAGKRTNLTRKESRGQDHPRVCGEKLSFW